MNPEINESSPLVAALIYAAKGWPVAPLWWPEGNVCACPQGKDCKSAAKHPLTRNGLKDATTDEDVIRRWWTKWPKANVALVTGVAFDVLDIDNTDWFDGIEDLPEIDALSMPVVITGSHKWHVYFTPTGGGNRAKLSQFCDWRGRGGYVVAPPSVHQAGGKYQWRNQAAGALMPCPDELRVRVLGEMAQGGKKWDSDLIPDPNTDDPGPWSYEGLVERVRGAQEGERNAVLSWAGHRLWRDWAQGRPGDKMNEALGALAEAGFAIGLDEKEIKSCLRQR